MLIYGESGRREVAIAQGPGSIGRASVLDDLEAAIRADRKPVHDGAWGKATLEVALAIQASAREGREIMLRYQVGV